MKKTFVVLGLFVSLCVDVSPGQFRDPVSGDLQVPNAAGFQAEEPARKSVLLAIGLSLVLPGMGELYAENFDAGRYLLAADGALWLAYAGFVLHGDWVREDARTFAVQHAGVDFAGKDEAFDVDLGNFGSVTEYNQLRLRNREYDRLYTLPAYAWQWDSEGSRMRFKRLRIRSDEMYQTSKFVIGAIVVNRLVSAFIAARSVSRYNKSLLDGWRMGAQLDGGPLTANGIRLVLTKEL